MSCLYSDSPKLRRRPLSGALCAACIVLLRTTHGRVEFAWVAQVDAKCDKPYSFLQAYILKFRNPGHLDSRARLAFYFYAKRSK